MGRIGVATVTIRDTVAETITLSLVDSNNIGADVSDTQSLTYYTNVNYELQVIEPTTVGQIRIVTIKVSSPLGACPVLCAVLVVLSLDVSRSSIAPAKLFLRSEMSLRYPRDPQKCPLPLSTYRAESVR